MPQAIVKNKEAIATLEKRQAHLECRIAFQEEEARRRGREGDKRGALFALKRKKMFEKELEQLGNAHLTLEQQIMTLESAQAQQVAVGALAAGVTAQKVLNQQLNINKIDDLMEDMQEQASLQNELAQVLSQGNPLSDDAELLAELHEIEAKQLEETLADACPVPSTSPGRILASRTPAFESSPPPGMASSRLPVAIDVQTTAHRGISSGPNVLELAAPTHVSDEEQLQKLLHELS